MSRPTKILIADDDPVLRELIPAQISSDEFSFVTVGKGMDVVKKLKNEEIHVVLLDVMLPDVSGIRLLTEITKVDDSPEVIMLTADKSLGTGLEAMRRGAYDYITKPAEPDEIEALIRKAAEKFFLLRQNEKLKIAVKQQNVNLTVTPVYGSSSMDEIYKQAERIADLETTLLVTGESGTGKDVLARWVHANSSRSESPLISVNCGALPETLFESEFFGYEKGSFTGANTQKIGLIEAADGSTLFLDEIGEMPLTMQVKLLHFLENSTFRRIGSTRDKRVDVRVIAATNKNLPEEIAEGNFRSDLYYRLNVIAFHIPSLRNRVDDIPELVDHFLSSFRERYKRPNLQISDSAIDKLKSSYWDGNIRELKNTLERTVALTEDDLIDTIYGLDSNTPKKTEISNKSEVSTTSSLADVEKEHILRVLESVGGKREKAASVLGITSRTLYRKLKEYNKTA